MGQRGEKVLDGQPQLSWGVPRVAGSVLRSSHGGVPPALATSAPKMPSLACSWTTGSKRSRSWLKVRRSEWQNERWPQAVCAPVCLAQTVPSGPHSESPALQDRRACRWPRVLLPYTRSGRRGADFSHS